MNRRTFLAASSTTLLGSMFGETTRSFAESGSLSARGTPGGPWVTPYEKSFIYSEIRYPETVPTTIDIDGLVDTPARYSVDDLAKVPPIKKILTMECFANTAGGPLIYNTSFEGASLSVLFQKAGVRPEAKAARIECIDGHAPYLLPLSELQRKDTLLVGKLAGRVVSLQHGGPFTRVFIPSAGGNHQPKWVRRITLVGDTATEHPAPPNAGFLEPTPPGAVGSIVGTTLNGYAFSGPESVGKVEFSTDNGSTYQLMPLPPQPDPDVWITWEVTWHPPARGFYVLRVKATSASGRKQDIPGVIGIDVR